MNEYPMVALIVRHGRAMTWAATAVAPIASLVMMAYGWPWPVLAGGIAAGAVLYVVVASYVELIRIVWDTLVPK